MPTYCIFIFLFVCLLIVFGYGQPYQRTGGYAQPAEARFGAVGAAAQSCSPGVTLPADAPNVLVVFFSRPWTLNAVASCARSDRDRLRNRRAVIELEHKSALSHGMRIARIRFDRLLFFEQCRLRGVDDGGGDERMLLMREAGYAHPSSAELLDGRLQFDRWQWVPMPMLASRQARESRYGRPALDLVLALVSCARAILGLANQEGHKLLPLVTAHHQFCGGWSLLVGKGRRSQLSVAEVVSPREAARLVSE